MEKLNLFTQLRYPLSETIDNYFELYGRKTRILSGKTLDGIQAIALFPKTIGQYVLTALTTTLPSVAPSIRFFANKFCIEIPRPARPANTPTLKAPPTRAEFIAAIRCFEEKHQVKLEDFLINSTWNGNQRLHHRDRDFINENQARLREEFMTDHVIGEYLARDSRFVPFYENRPALVSDPTKPDESDYYECKIYELAAQENGTMFLPYRDRVQNDTFYLKGTYDKSIFRNVKSSSKGHCMVMQQGEDIYAIRDHLREVELGAFVEEIKKKYEGIQFILSPNSKDTHATTVVSVIQKGTFRHLASIFINSSQDTKYFNFINERFNSRINSCILLTGDRCTPIFTEFKEKMGDKTFYIDEKSREGYLLNPSGSAFPNDPGEKAVYKALSEQKIDVVHKLEDSQRYGMRYIIEGTRHIPLIDASHHLQTEKEDTNCSIYSFNFLQGIADMLDDEAVTDKIYRLAEQMDSGAAPEKEAAEATLAAMFRDDLKRYIPSYYDEDENRKPYDLVKEHHLYQRWDLGSLGMKTECLRDNGFLAKESLRKD